MKKLTLFALVFVMLVITLASCAPAITAENAKNIGNPYILFRLIDKQNNVICYSISSGSLYCIHLDRVLGNNGAVPNE